MKKTLAVKSLAAGLGVLLSAGPVAAQVVTGAARASLSGVSAAAASVSAPTAALAPALLMPSAALSAASAPLAAPALVAASPTKNGRMPFSPNTGFSVWRRPMNWLVNPL